MQRIDGFQDSAVRPDMLDPGFGDQATYRVEPGEMIEVGLHDFSRIQVQFGAWDA